MEYIPLKVSPHPCGYFSDRQALFEHYITVNVTDEERSCLLASGFRAFGKYLFRPLCPGCHACVPIRLKPESFLPSRSQRRVIKKCSPIEVIISSPVYSDEKLAIYQEHLKRFERVEDPEAGPENFKASFFEPSVPSLEFDYYIEGELAAFGIVHETKEALSSVYFCYKDAYSKYSLGTYSILREIEEAKLRGKTYYYLGYYIRDNHFMAYKGQFQPAELLTNQGWTPFKSEVDPRFNPISLLS